MGEKFQDLPVTDYSLIIRKTNSNPCSYSGQLMPFSTHWAAEDNGRNCGFRERERNQVQVDTQNPPNCEVSNGESDTQ